LSVFGSEESAEANAKVYPKILARVDLAAGFGFMIARTYADIDDHDTVWGDPVELLERVTAVTTIDEPGVG
jgi:hypothetical protein